jgi:hypothetical protein
MDMKAYTIALIVVVIVTVLVMGGEWVNQKNNDTIVSRKAIMGIAQNVGCESDNAPFRCTFTVYQPKNASTTTWTVEGLPEKIKEGTPVNWIVKQTEREKEYNSDIWEFEHANDTIT